MKKFIGILPLLMAGIMIMVSSGCNPSGDTSTPDPTDRPSRLNLEYYILTNSKIDTGYYDNRLYSCWTEIEDIPVLEVGKEYYCLLEFGQFRPRKGAVGFNYDDEYIEITCSTETPVFIYPLRGLRATELLEVEVYVWEWYPIDKPDNKIAKSKKIYFKFADATQTEP